MIFESETNNQKWFWNRKEKFRNGHSRGGTGKIGLNSEEIYRSGDGYWFIRAASLLHMKPIGSCFQLDVQVPKTTATWLVIKTQPHQIFQMEIQKNSLEEAKVYMVVGRKWGKVIWSTLIDKNMDASLSKHPDRESLMIRVSWDTANFLYRTGSFFVGVLFGKRESIAVV